MTLQNIITAGMAIWSLIMLINQLQLTLKSELYSLWDA